MSKSNLRRWESEFRAAAMADGLDIFRDHLQRLGLPDSPGLLLEGTILIVSMCSAYAKITGRSRKFKQFLDLQTYDPGIATGALYAYTFDMCGKAFGRVLVKTADDNFLDLADLYGYPWYDYKVVGYRSIQVSHPDWSPVRKSEVKELAGAIEYDLFFDYSEAQLNLWFDDSLDETYLFVNV